MNHSAAPQIPGSIGIPEAHLSPWPHTPKNTLQSFLLWGPVTSIGGMKQKGSGHSAGKEQESLAPSS